QLATVEGVQPIGESVRPRQQRLAATAIGHLMCLKAIDGRDTVDGVLAQCRANLDDDGMLAPASNLELAPTRQFRGQRCLGPKLPTNTVCARPVLAIPPPLKSSMRWPGQAARCAS